MILCLSNRLVDDRSSSVSTDYLGI